MGDTRSIEEGEEMTAAEKEHKNKITARLVTAGLCITKNDGVWGKCQHCGRFGYIVKRCLNTAYVKEDDNWLTSCVDCFGEGVDYFSGLWDDYYSGCM